jgi:Ca2+-binding RTX toxin-like protein
MRSLIGFTLVATGVLFSNAALATCPDLSTTNYGVCSINAGLDTITCDLTANGDTGALTTTTAVTDPGGLGGLCATDYCVWGFDSAGNNFCYEYSSTAALDTLVVLGSSGKDTVTFRFDGTSLGKGIFNLRERSLAFIGEADGFGNEDLLQGSDRVSAYYTDVFYGGADADSIYGLSGNDLIDGGDGGDWLHGGAGDDWVCGRDGLDHLWGEEGDDILFSAQSAPFSQPVDGGPGSDTCGADGTSTYANCETTGLTTCPF